MSESAASKDEKPKRRWRTFVEPREKSQWTDEEIQAAFDRVEAKRAARGGKGNGKSVDLRELGKNWVRKVHGYG